MKRTLTLLLIAFSLSVSAQERSEIIAILKEYTQHAGKTGYQHRYVDEKLNPILLQLEKKLCEKPDDDVLERFLDMIIASAGSANETPGDVLAGLFICRPDWVARALQGKYKDQGLMEELKFGFANRTFDPKDRPSNYGQLKRRLEKMDE